MGSFTQVDEEDLDGMPNSSFIVKEERTQTEVLLMGNNVIQKNRGKHPQLYYREQNVNTSYFCMATISNSLLSSALLDLILGKTPVHTRRPFSSSDSSYFLAIINNDRHVNHSHLLNLPSHLPLILTVLCLLCPFPFFHPL